MGLYVFADPPDRYRAWLRNMARPARAPRTRDERLGRDVFEANQCASCHTIRGTQARGGIGPDLTHLETRTTLAALTLPNRPPDLARWIADPQHIKPGNRMPGLNLTSDDFRVLLAYLETLK
jgi:cytochrome c oxidase subunit 2